jgi:hypothetical protein
MLAFASCCTARTLVVYFGHCCLNMCRRLFTSFYFFDTDSCLYIKLFFSSCLFFVFLSSRKQPQSASMTFGRSIWRINSNGNRYPMRVMVRHFNNTSPSNVLEGTLPGLEPAACRIPSIPYTTGSNFSSALPYEADPLAHIAHQSIPDVPLISYVHFTIFSQSFPSRERP